MNGPNPKLVEMNRCGHRAFIHTKKTVELKSILWRGENIGLFGADVWECQDCKAVELRIFPVQSDAQAELQKLIKQ